MLAQSSLGRHCIAQTLRVDLTLGIEPGKFFLFRFLECNLFVFLCNFAIHKIQIHLISPNAEIKRSLGKHQRAAVAVQRQCKPLRKPIQLVVSLTDDFVRSPDLGLQCVIRIEQFFFS